MFTYNRLGIHSFFAIHCYPQGHGCRPIINMSTRGVLHGAGITGIQNVLRAKLLWSAPTYSRPPQVLPVSWPYPRVSRRPFISSRATPLPGKSAHPDQETSLATISVGLMLTPMS